MKTCNQCLVEKPTSAFSPHGNGFKAKCRKCRARNERNRLRANGLDMWVKLLGWSPPGRV